MSLTSEQRAQRVGYEVICSQSDDEWHARRAEGVGGSEMPIVLGLKSKSPLELYAEKTGAQKPEDIDTEAAEWGDVLEPLIAERWAKRTGHSVAQSRKLLRSTDYPWLQCTLDWCVNNPAPGVTTAPLEIKTHTAFRASDWEDGPPRPYYVQCQQQIAVMGVDRAFIACLIGGQQLVWDEVRRDDAMIDRMLSAGREFWDAVQTQTPRPEWVDGSDSAGRALSSIFRDPADRVVELPAWMEAKADELESIQARVKQLDAEAEEIKNQIKNKIGKAKCGRLPSGVIYEWKQQSRKGGYTRPSTFRVLRRKEAT